jgi:molybdenum cofactor cytidylyltransferase
VGDAVGLVLAGGDSTRMGEPKALLTYDGQPFLGVVLARMAQAGLDRRVVVLGRHADRIRRSIDLEGIQAVVNPRPECGQLSSLQEGARALLGPGGTGEAAAVVVALVDHPAVAASTYTALVSAWREAGQAEDAVVVARQAGKRGHPVLIGRRALVRALELPATASMREALRLPGTVRHEVDVDDPGVHRDVDTPEDYARLVAGEKG